MTTAKFIQGISKELNRQSIPLQRTAGLHKSRHKRADSFQKTETDKTDELFTKPLIDQPSGRSLKNIPVSGMCAAVFRNNFHDPASRQAVKQLFQTKNRTIKWVLPVNSKKTHSFISEPDVLFFVPGELYGNKEGFQAFLKELMRDGCIPVFYIPILKQYSTEKSKNTFPFRSFCQFLMSDDISLLPVFSPRKENTSAPLVKIGSPIYGNSLLELFQQEKLLEYIDARLQFLKTGTSFVEKLIRHIPKITIADIEISETSSRTHILREIESLRKSRLLFSQGDYDVFSTRLENIPAIKKEMGRLREITFRAVGEGSMTGLDLDEYDSYYDQIFLWDKKKEKIVGGYRAGNGSEIMRKYGEKGLYTRSLFKYEASVFPVLQRSIELGRSFIIPEYQQKRLPLFLLWKGILMFSKHYTNTSYIIGSASISRCYTKGSVRLITAYLKKHCCNHELAKAVDPKIPFNPQLKPHEKTLIDTLKTPCMEELDKLIKDREPDNKGVPVLIKRYLMQNAEVIGFNLDPKFSDSLDVLMILGQDDIPSQTIENLSK